ncbi:unnamed protein product [Echinostoma caproni]|uniref:Apple domain-containing protein n=1 Tax=Echinostoma caproni TaxID=27848 RepID=A0A183AQ46_9TREM|nr:unnamed protein product [Echinostoma caproni]
MSGYMLGRELKQFVTLNKLKSPVWINLHSLLHSTSALGQQNWIYGEMAPPNVMYALKELPMTRQFSVFDRVAIVTTDGHTIRTNTDKKQYGFVCGYRDYIQTNRLLVQTELFLTDPPHKEVNFHATSDDTQGCFEYHLHITMIACALKCHLHAMCRTFYYKPEHRKCIHTLFVESLMPASEQALSPEAARRFRRPDWNILIRRIDVI